LKKLEDKVTLVTGSGRGFGRSIALAYSSEGAKVVAASRTRSELEDMANVARSRGGEVLTIPTDLSKEDEIYSLRDMVLDTYGRLDVLVNNAATSLWKTVDEMTVQDWDRTIAVNLRAPFILVKAFLETMKNQGRGSIINVTSRSAELGFVAEIGYCPSKFGIEGLTQCLALELKPYNIAVNSLNVASTPGKRLKPTGLTLAEAKKRPKELRERYADDDSMVEAFKDAWTFLALQDGFGVSGQRLGTKELAEYLRRNGWEAAVENWRGKLTKAVYVTYDWPKSVRYQTGPGGSETKELKFE
jgi:NAD(P)-dependent dehydrogenase (short-subunit alcohol dehydrogenase family)